MHERTVACLRALEDAHWFTQVGAADGGAARVVGSWEEALKLCFSPSYDWDNLCTAANNQYSMHLFAKARERFNKWNSVVDELEPAVRDLVRRKLKGVANEVNQRLAMLLEAKQVDKKVEAAEEFERVGVYGDVLLACMETEYADVHPPGFFANLVYWYVKGHFPCGWDGPQRRQMWDFKRNRIVSRGEYPNLYPPGYYDPIAHWYEKGFGDWQGIPAGGKLIVY